jgi:Ca-activated chloride channel family protein
MFRFANTDAFYLLLLVPLLAVLFILARRMRGRRMARFGDPASVVRLIPGYSPRRELNNFILLLVALALIVTAVARPQSGARLRERQSTGVEMILVVDVSNSMLAEDLAPTRLDRTKAAIDRLLGGTGQDRVGLVAFAGDAYVQLPVTADRPTARQFAARLAPDMVSRQGTAIGAAIELAAASFTAGGDGGRVMVVISDGENHEDDPLAAARAAAEQGINIYTIGIGTPEGAPIMLGDDYVRDEKGETVVSHLDEKMLQDVALATGGAYVRATNQDFGLEGIIARIHETEGQRRMVPVYEQYDEYFQWLLGLALLMLLMQSAPLLREVRGGR